MEIFSFTGYLRDGIEEKLMFSEQIKLLKENTDVLELLGVMVSGDDRIALLNWRGRQFALGTGEMRDGITLISVNEASAVILLEDEEKILNLK